MKEAEMKHDKKTPHSLRRGGATWALRCGIPPVCIKLQGDWSSDAWLVYVEFMDSKLKRRTLGKMEIRGRRRAGLR